MARRKTTRRRRRGGSAVCIVTILILAGLAWVNHTNPELISDLTSNLSNILTIDSTANPATGAITEAVVERVIDGDTIVLQTGERVRFIGIDAPEIGDPGADEATNFVRERVEGRTVWLELDGNDTDRFGRLRRYIWLQMPTDSHDEYQIRAYMLNAMLLEYGLAEVMILGNVRNEALFRRISR